MDTGNVEFGGFNAQNTKKEKQWSPQGAESNPLPFAAQRRQERIKKLEARLQREKARDSVASRGNYDTYNSFSGNGDSAYYGGGLLFRHDTTFGLYGEASIRAGHARSEYSGPSSRRTDFDIRAMYYGGHLGAGVILRPTAVSSINIFAKGLWTRLKGDTDTNKRGDHMRVDATDSLRSQLGVKYSYAVADNVSLSVKTAWEYEWDGKTTGRYNGVRIDRTDMGGHTGLAELGMEWNVTDRATLGVTVRGSLGARRGVGGNVNIGFGF